MNEVFNIKRFGALWIKTNRENLKTNLVFIAVMAVLTFLCLCKFNPFVTEYTVVNSEAEKTDFLLHYQSLYRNVFWGLLFLFSIVAALRSFKDIVSPYKSTTALLLPASAFEKYLLAFLNSTLIVFVVYLVIFYGLAWFVNFYKYGGAEEASLAEGWLGIHISVINGGEQVIHPVVGNVFNIESLNEKFIEINGISRNEISFLFWNLAIIGWFYVISIFMWGSITFRKRTVLWTLLTHFILFLGIGYALYRIFRMVIETYIRTVHFANFINIEPDIFSPYWILLLYLLPLTYLGVVWIKLRRKQVN